MADDIRHGGSRAGRGESGSIFVDDTRAVARGTDAIELVSGAARFQERLVRRNSSRL
jgi:hypothetical protein